MSGKRLRVLSLLPGEPRHLTHFDDDLGERQSAQLLGCHSGFYGNAERIYERKKPFVVVGDEISG